MNLKPFQIATVNRALEALTAPGGSRRFLVADEVGLGKTRVAQGVIQRLCERPDRSQLKVFYVCSSVSIAIQNRDAILEILPSAAAREEATVNVDRLTMLPAAPPPPSAPFVLYTLTPNTLPGSRRTGRAQERAFIWGLLCRAIPGLERHTSLGRVMRHGVGEDAWENYYLPAGAGEVDKAPVELATAVRRELAERLGLTAAAQRSTLINALKQKAWDDDSCRTLIHDTRMAVARAALRTISPDLVILDEFQRFFEDLPLDRDEDLDGDAQKVLRLILEGFRDTSGARRRAPAVLLLSATPYPAFATWHGGSGEHHKDFFRLLRFLAGSRGYEEVTVLKGDFQQYREQLETEAPGGARAAQLRDAIQQRLMKLMSRTERPRRIGRPDDLPVERIPAPLEPLDVRLFRHLRDAASPADKGFVTGYWSSIPFPLQTMDRTYELRRRATPAPLGPIRNQTALCWDAIRSFEPVPNPHPRLRQLLDAVPPQLLALPWLPPTREWWPLGRCFKAAEELVGKERRSKALVFSRFRAVPRSLAVAASYAVEQHCYDLEEQKKRSGEAFGFEYHLSEGARPRPERRRRPKGSFAFPLSSKNDTALRTLAMFAPLPELARLGDPLPLIAGQKDCPLLLGKAIGKIERALRQKLGAFKGHREQVTVARWAFELERRGSEWGDVQEALRGWASQVHDVDESDPTAPAGVRKAVEDGLKRSGIPDGGPSDRELHELAQLALLAPGNVLFRAVERIFGSPQRPIHVRERVRNVASVSIGELRGYLDAPEFHLLLRDGRRSQHPNAVRQAVWDGNLESVLDEYFALQRGLGAELRPSDVRTCEAAALQRLREALSLPAASLQISALDGDSSSEFRVRCHAALPFGLGVEVAAESTGAIRSDVVRKAFNSPFRPHLLVTTSIGQEGLDFHAFCDHVIHWDLPHNPVDLEQREGRIDRYAGLAQRKALARSSRNTIGGARSAALGASPWLLLAAAQRDGERGLSPWWVHPESRIRRSVYVPPFSRTTTDLARLLESLSLYRLALGQVDQESLVAALQRRLEGASPRARKELLAWLESVRIDLAPGDLQESAAATS